MKLWPVAPFFTHFWNRGTYKTLQHVISLQQYKKWHAAMFCMFPDSKSEWKKWATGQSFIRKEITTYRIGTLRGHSKTTWTRFWPFLTTYLNVDIFYPKRGEKGAFFDHLPTSSCPRSFWMTPYIALKTEYELVKSQNSQRYNIFLSIKYWIGKLFKTNNQQETFGFIKQVK